MCFNFDLDFDNSLASPFSLLICATSSLRLALLSLPMLLVMLSHSALRRVKLRLCLHVETWGLDVLGDDFGLGLHMTRPTSLATQLCVADTW